MSEPIRLPIVTRTTPNWDFSYLTQTSSSTGRPRTVVSEKPNGFGLTQRDCEDIGYDLTQLSIFFPEPIKLDIEGLEQTEWGMGYGGLSSSLFTRSTDCNLCGMCCKNGHRRIWFWWGHERHPDTPSVRPYEFTLNGVRVPVFVHTNAVNGYSRCDFLVDLDREVPNLRDVQKGAACSLHVDGLKPSHCSVNPQTGVWKTNSSRGPRLLLSRRLPSRNWRYPLCPIDVYSSKMTEDQIEQDRKMWDDWRTALQDVPGQCVEFAYRTWENTIADLQNGRYANVVPDNIYFEDHIK